MLYNWQQNDWTEFVHDPQKIEALALDFRGIAGQSLGMLEGMGQAQRHGLLVNLLVQEAIQTSAIEGELISRADVISSIKENLA